MLERNKSLFRKLEIEKERSEKRCSVLVHLCEEKAAVAQGG